MLPSHSKHRYQKIVQSSNQNDTDASQDDESTQSNNESTNQSINLSNDHFTVGSARRADVRHDLENSNQLTSSHLSNSDKITNQVDVDSNQYGHQSSEDRSILLNPSKYQSNNQSNYHPAVQLPNSLNTDSIKLKHNLPTSSIYNQSAEPHDQTKRSTALHQPMSNQQSQSFAMGKSLDHTLPSDSFRPNSRTNNHSFISPFSPTQAQLLSPLFNPSFYEPTVVSPSRLINSRVINWMYRYSLLLSIISTIINQSIYQFADKTHTLSTMDSASGALLTLLAFGVSIQFILFALGLWGLLKQVNLLLYVSPKYVASVYLTVIITFAQLIFTVFNWDRKSFLIKGYTPQPQSNMQSISQSNYQFLNQITETNDPWTIFITCLYFSATTMTSTGFGDNTATKWFGQMVVDVEMSISMLFHVGIFSLAISQFNRGQQRGIERRVSIGQMISQSINRSRHQSVDRRSSIDGFFKRSQDQSIASHRRLSIDQSINQLSASELSVNQLSINQLPVSQLIHSSTDLSDDSVSNPADNRPAVHLSAQIINQPSNQPINQSVDQSGNRSLDEFGDESMDHWHDAQSIGESNNQSISDHPSPLSLWLLHSINIYQKIFFHPTFKKISKILIDWLLIESLILCVVVDAILYAVYSINRSNFQSKNQTNNQSIQIFCVTVVSVMSVIQFIHLTNASHRLVESINQSKMSFKFFFVSYLSLAILFSSVYMILFIASDGDQFVLSNNSIDLLSGDLTNQSTGLFTDQSVNLWQEHAINLNNPIIHSFDQSIDNQTTTQTDQPIDQSINFFTLHSIFFSFSMTTLSNSGFGDMYADRSTSRLIVSSEMLIAVIYGSVIVALACDAVIRKVMMNRSIDHLIDRSNGASIDRSIDGSNDLSTSHSANQSNNQSTDSSLDTSSDHSEIELMCHDVKG